MGALGDIWKSERGLAFLFVTACVFVFVLTGHATFEQFIDFEKWALPAYLVTKTVTSAVETHSTAKVDAATAAAKGAATKAPDVLVVESEATSTR
jgi:hypothetical protein